MCCLCGEAAERARNAQKCGIFLLFFTMSFTYSHKKVWQLYLLSQKPVCAIINGK